MAFFTARTDPALFRCPCERAGCTAPAPTGQLLQRLNLMRAFLERPITVTSGPRCAFHNQRVGGDPSSAHLTGQAADLRCRSSAERWAMLEAAHQAGFRRIGIGADFVHVDVAEDPHHPVDVVWTYYPKAAHA